MAGAALGRQRFPLSARVLSSPAPAWKLDSSHPARARAAPPSLGPELGATSVQDLEERQEERVMVTAKVGCPSPRCWDRGSVSSAVV